MCADNKLIGQCAAAKRRSARPIGEWRQYARVIHAPPRLSVAVTELDNRPAFSVRLDAPLSLSPSLLLGERDWTLDISPRRFPSPGGRIENSPAFQRWVRWPNVVRPEGTGESGECHGAVAVPMLWQQFNRPFGTRCLNPTIPPLKGWAILKSPFGRASHSNRRNPVPSSSRLAVGSLKAIRVFRRFADCKSAMQPMAADAGTQDDNHKRTQRTQSALGEGNVSLRSLRSLRLMNSRCLRTKENCCDS